MRRIVLDTNCLLASISSRGEYFRVWTGLHEGLYVLCVSNEIIAEYEEVIARKTTRTIAANVVNALVDSEYVEFVDPRYRLNLIAADPDDNKFVDCAFAANATFIVSNDRHFAVLKEVDFPRIEVIRIQEFVELL